MNSFFFKKKKEKGGGETGGAMRGLGMWKMKRHVEGFG